MATAVLRTKLLGTFVLDSMPQLLRRLSSQKLDNTAPGDESEVKFYFSVNAATDAKDVQSYARLKLGFDTAETLSTRL